MTTMIGSSRTDLPPGLADGEPTLFQQTVPRHLVHRAAVSEVFITDLSIAGEDTFHLGAQWPRSHGFFGPKAGYHDPMLLTETIRQATLVIAHQAYGVPQDSKFVLQEIWYDIDEPGLRLDGRPADIVLIAVAYEVRRRGKSVAGMRLEFACYRDLRRVGGGGINWRCVTPTSYARLRGRRAGVRPAALPLPPPVDPCLAGRDNPADVVLAATGQHNMWTLRVDTGHPVMFDHPVDHVPGMTSMEGMRQAALCLTGAGAGVPIRGRFSFDRYLELDLPCLVVAERRPPAVADHSVHVTIDQDGHTAATGHIDLLVHG